MNANACFGVGNALEGEERGAWMTREHAVPFSFWLSRQSAVRGQCPICAGHAGPGPQRVQLQRRRLAEAACAFCVWREARHARQRRFRRHQTPFRRSHIWQRRQAMPPRRLAAPLSSFPSSRWCAKLSVGGHGGRGRERGSGCGHFSCWWEHRCARSLSGVEIDDVGFGKFVHGRIRVWSRIWLLSWSSCGCIWARLPVRGERSQYCPGHRDGPRHR